MKIRKTDFAKASTKLLQKFFGIKKKKKKGNAEEIDTTYMSEEDKQKLKE